MNKNMYQVYISVHDQDLILKCEQNRLFRYLKNYKYLFLGMRPIDKLSTLMDKIIVVRNLPVNIEDKKCLYDYTGHYALARNVGLVKSKYIIIIHYDCFIYKNFLPSIQKAFKKTPDCFINFQPHLLTCDYFLPDIFARATKQAYKEVYGLDIVKRREELVEKGDVYWQGGGSYACSFETLKKYIDWVEPLLPYIIVDPMAAHNIERTVKFFCVENHIPEIFLPNIMEHIYNSSHDQAYQTEAETMAFKKRFSEFISGELFREKRNRDIKRFIKRILPIKRNKDYIILTICSIELRIKRKNTGF